MITDKEILDLIDGNFKEDKANDLLNRINANEELKQRYIVLKSVDYSLANQNLPELPNRFTDMVMSNLYKKLAPEISNMNIFRKKNLFIVLGIILVCFVAGVVLLSQFSLSQVLPAIDPQEITLQDKTISFDPGNFVNQEWFFKGFIYLNAFLALFLFERAILRPYFKQRRQHYSF